MWFWTLVQLIKILVLVIFNSLYYFQIYSHVPVIYYECYYINKFKKLNINLNYYLKNEIFSNGYNFVGNILVKPYDIDEKKTFDHCRDVWKMISFIWKSSTWNHYVFKSQKLLIFHNILCLESMWFDSNLSSFIILSVNYENHI
jgi:hypothetical protein